MEHVTLNTGARMPLVGLGTYLMSDEDVASTVPVAVEAGYRLFDTASRYYNEGALGKAIAAAGIPREELFITSKLWFKDYGYERTKEACAVSLELLGLDYLDLYLMHQPFNDYYGAWRALEELHEQGLIRAIGVSNFYPDRYADLIQHNTVVPAVNQRQVHPFNQQIDVQAQAVEHGTVLQAWSPLGQGNAELLEHPVLRVIAESHGVSVPQVILRWLTQRGVAVVVKSTHAERLAANIDVFDFALSDAEMAAIETIDRKQGPDHQNPAMLERLLTFE